jgi:hypothetical protein
MVCPGNLLANKTYLTVTPDFYGVGLKFEFQPDPHMKCKNINVTVFRDVKP